MGFGNKKRLAIVLICSLLLVTLLSSMVVAAPPSGKGNQPSYNGYNNAYQGLSRSAVFGNIEWENEIYSNYSIAQLRSAVSINKAEISVDSKNYPELNSNANITFYDTEISGEVSVYRDGVLCKECELEIIGDDDFLVSVKKFSTYTVNASIGGNYSEGATEYEGLGIGLVPLASVYFAFEDDFNDTSYYQNEITLNGNPVILPNSGQFGDNTAYLDGVGDSIQVTASSSVTSDLDKAFTIVTLGSMNVSSSRQTVIGYSGNSNVRNIEFFMPANDIIDYIIANGTDFYSPATSGTNSIGYFNGSMAYDSNTNTTMLWNDYFYEDIQTTNLTSDPARDMFVGALNAISNWNGAFDMLAIYQKKLTEEQIINVREQTYTYIFDFEGNYTSDAILMNSSDVQWTNITLSCEMVDYNLTSTGSNCFNYVDVLYSTSTDNISFSSFTNVSNVSASGNDLISILPFGETQDYIKTRFVLYTDGNNTPLVDEEFLVESQESTPTVFTATNIACGDTVTPNTLCDVFAEPAMSCGSYTYNLYNVTDKLLSDEALQNVDDDIYVFNFNQSAEGAYLARFCDGSTKEIIVKEGDDMFVAMALGLAITALLYLLFGFKTEHNLLKILCAFYAFGTLLLIPAMFSIGIDATASIWIKSSGIAFVTLATYIFLYSAYFHVFKPYIEKIRK